MSLGVVAAAGLVFLYVAESFAVFDERWKERRTFREVFRPALGTLSRVWSTALSDSLHRVTLIAVFVIPLAWVLMYPPFSLTHTRVAAVQPSTGMDTARAVLRIDGNWRGISTDFPHAEHQKRLGGDTGCVVCHHVSLPKDHSTPCSRCHRSMVKPTLIFDHTAHFTYAAVQEKLTGLHPENRSCTVCHTPNQPKCAANAGPCLECHDKNIWSARVPANDHDLMYACSFSEAMHSTCVTCHAREVLRQNNKRLDNCATCHVSLKSKKIPVGTEKSAVAAVPLSRRMASGATASGR